MRPLRSAVLVTGGNGFIGTALAEQASKNFESWVTFDSFHPQVHKTKNPNSSFPKDARIIRGDVTSPGELSKALEVAQPNIVVHLAAETGTGQSMTEAARHTSVNVTGTANLIDALSKCESLPERIVLASSRAVYGEGSWDSKNGLFNPPPRGIGQLEAKDWAFGKSRPLPSVAGQTRPNPSSVYGATKLAQEHLLEVWCRANGVQLVILRLQNVYGPGQAINNAYTGIVTLFTRLSLSSEPIPVYEDGLIGRDFVYISDVVEAIEASMTNDFSENVSVFDIGSGVTTTVLQLAETISSTVGSPAPHITGQFRTGDVRWASTSIEAARRDLGWEPKVSLDSGLERLIPWIQNSTK